MSTPPESDRPGRWTPEMIAAYWRVIVPILSFGFGCYIVFNDVIIDPPVDTLTSCIGVAIAGFGPALRDLIAR